LACGTHALYRNSLRSVEKGEGFKDLICKAPSQLSLSQNGRLLSLSAVKGEVMLAFEVEAIL
jgi:hypothetical protein